MSPQTRTLCFVAIIAAIVWVPSLLPPGFPKPAATPVPAVEVRVRSGSPPLPTDCGTDDVVDLVRGFLDAFNRGDRSHLARFFSTLPEHPAPTAFRWYSVTGAGDHFVAYDLQTLFAYFVERHEQHEVLRLVRLEVAAGRNGEIGIVYDLVRRADDFPERLVGGKGGIDCERRAIFVWSMGDASALTDVAAPVATPVDPSGASSPPAQFAL